MLSSSLWALLRRVFCLQRTDLWLNVIWFDFVLLLSGVYVFVVVVLVCLFLVLFGDVVVVLSFCRWLFGDAVCWWVDFILLFLLLLLVFGGFGGVDVALSLWSLSVAGVLCYCGVGVGRCLVVWCGRWNHPSPHHYDCDILCRRCHHRTPFGFVCLSFSHLHVPLIEFAFELWKGCVHAVGEITCFNL